MIKFINRPVKPKTTSIIMQILIVLLSIYGCGTNAQSDLSDFNKLRTEVKMNYDSNKTIFHEIKACEALNFIKVIEFKGNNNVAIEYKLNDTAKWEKITDEIHSETIKSVLKIEGLGEEYLFNLEKKLGSINANRVWIIDLFNRYDGTSSKVLEVKYLKEVNGLHFFYKVFEKPLDSIPKEFYSLQIKDSIGEILDKNVIAYYK